MAFRFLQDGSMHAEMLKRMQLQELQKKKAAAQAEIISQVGDLDSISLAWSHYSKSVFLLLLLIL